MSGTAGTRAPSPGACGSTSWDPSKSPATHRERGLVAGQEGADDLRASVALVRDRPFLGIDPRTSRKMTTAIADVAHCLATAPNEAAITAARPKLPRSASLPNRPPTTSIATPSMQPSPGTTPLRRGG